MKAIKNAELLLMIILAFTLTLTGCGEANTVSQYVVSDKEYTEKTNLENAVQPEQLTAGKDVYASVYFIESPEGMEYSAKWFTNGNEIKTDTQKMPTDKHGIIVFSLEGDLVVAGTLKFEVSYGSDVLCSKELTVVKK